MKLRGRKAERVVRHTLADGTVKEYRYSPYRGKPNPNRPGADSIAALIEAYRSSPKWHALAEPTKRMYLIYLRAFDKAGHLDVKDVRRRDILLLHDRIATTRGPGAAKGFLRASSALFNWAVDREWIEHSPVTRIKTAPSKALRAWTRDEADAALADLPEHLRRVVILGLYTGQRRGDLISMPWTAYDGETIRLTQQKTGEKMVIPCHAALKAELDQWQAQWKDANDTDLTILRDGHGKPWQPTLLSHYLPEALARIGLPRGLNVHGLRKLAAANLADAGCSTHEIAAVTGHRTLAMVQLYTRSADQERLASAAIVRLSQAVYKRKKAQ